MPGGQQAIGLDTHVRRAAVVPPRELSPDEFLERLMAAVADLLYDAVTTGRLDDLRRRRALAAGDAPAAREVA